MEWGFAVVAPAAAGIAYSANGRTSSYATFDLLNLLEMVLLIALSFQALSQKQSNIVTQPGNVFVNSSLVVSFQIAATIVQAIRVLSLQDFGPFDLVPFALYLVIALHCKQTNGQILAWLLFAIASWRFAWYAYTKYELARIKALRALVKDTTDTENLLSKESLDDLYEQLNTVAMPSMVTEGSF